MKKRMVDLSVVITAHKEGIVAHKTILGILRCVEELDKNSVAYEIIVSLDNPDEATDHYYDRWRNDTRFVIRKVSYGNPADNRNSAISGARGKYVSVIDGDDIPSRNWLIDSYNVLINSKTISVVKPNYNFQFSFDNDEKVLWIMEPSFSKQEDAIILSYWNRWSVTTTAPKEVFEMIKYKPAVNGFGYEDYLWNCDIRAANITCLIAPGTTIFYRRRANSVTFSHIGAVLDYSELFTYKSINSIKLPKKVIRKDNLFVRIRPRLSRYYNFVFRQISKLPVFKCFMPSIAYNRWFDKVYAKLPKDFIEAWRDVNSIENQLYPTKDAILHLKYHPLSFNQHDTRFGLIYQKLLKQAHGRIDYLFLAPCLSGVGGTEKLIGNYMKALQAIHPDWNIALLSRIPFNKQTLECKFFPKGIRFINFGDLTSGLYWEVDNLWSRLLIQSGVKRIHIVNDEYWFRWLKCHEELIRKNDYIINVSLFMKEYTPEHDRIVSFADPCLTEIWPLVNGVFTDNENIITETLKSNAFDRSKLRVHYQPFETEYLTKPKAMVKSGPICEKVTELALRL